MATITINIPDAITNKVIDALCERYMYDENKSVGETKAQFSKRMLIEHIKDIVKEKEIKLAKSSIEQAVLTASNAELDLT